MLKSPSTSSSVSRAEARGRETQAPSAARLPVPTPHTHPRSDFSQGPGSPSFPNFPTAEGQCCYSTRLAMQAKIPATPRAHSTPGDFPFPASQTHGHSLHGRGGSFPITPFRLRDSCPLADASTLLKGSLAVFGARTLDQGDLVVPAPVTRRRDVSAHQPLVLTCRGQREWPKFRLPKGVPAEGWETGPARGQPQTPVPGILSPPAFPTAPRGAPLREPETGSAGRQLGNCSSH